MAALAAVAAAGMAGLLLLGAGYLYLAPGLPSVERLRDVQLQVPLRVYSREGALVAEFGEKRRSPVDYAHVPVPMVAAFLAAEDDRFFEHPGVDYQGILRAAWHLLLTGEKEQGGSTITMQVARNFFLSREKTYVRKLSEILLALRIERELTKPGILELYLNKIYLGQRAYGVGAAAQVYYGKRLDQLTLPQIAMIAGLPKAPSRDNPIADPDRARQRRNYVLRRMHELGYIDDGAYQDARARPLSAERHGLTVAVEAPYVGEMVRARMLELVGEEAYTAGYTVHTTIDASMQAAANTALRDALVAYDRRHGYRGVLGQVDAEAGPEVWDRALEGHRVVNGMASAVVTAVEERRARLYLGQGRTAVMDWKGMEWARPYVDVNRRGPVPERASDVLAPGDIVRVTLATPSAETQAQHRAPDADAAADPSGPPSARLAQRPAVQGALVALAPRDAAVRALAGGFDFETSEFNRAVQAQRQPGSSFKPFIYSAALASGLTPATVINDAPVVFEDDLLESTWRPENYSGRFYGPTRLREALVHSRNLVSIRVLRRVGVGFAVDYLTRFGFDAKQLPHNLSLALGTVSLTPLRLASGYAVFANGGFRVTPWFIERVEGPDGEVVFEAEPPRACPACEAPTARETAAVPPASAPRAASGIDTEAEERAPRVITPQNNYLINSMLRDVVRRGTGRRAMTLGRNDLAGKTGTTDDQRDAWFSGFNHEVVVTAWVGFDENQPLGRGETGARAALPMWIDFMRAALEGVPERPLIQPPGLVTLRIDAQTGLPTDADNPEAVFETFRAENTPQVTARRPGQKPADASGTASAPEHLF